MLCIYMPFWGIAGSEVRVLKTIIRFPKDEYLILIPIDCKTSLIKSLVYLEKDRDFRKINETINDAIELKPINNAIQHLWARGIASRYASYKYGRYVAYTAKRYGCEMVYMPYGNQTCVILGLKSSFPKISVLIQNTPIIETLVFEEGDPLTIMINNTRLREGKSGLKLLVSSLIKFAKLFMWRFIMTNVNLLTVSKSIPYELNKVIAGTLTYPAMHIMNNMWLALGIGFMIYLASLIIITSLMTDVEDLKNLADISRGINYIGPLVSRALNYLVKIKMVLWS